MRASLLALSLLLAAPAAAEPWAEVLVPVGDDSRAVLQQLEALVEGGDATRWRAQLPASSLPTLLASGLHVEVVAADTQQLRPTVSAARDEGYHSPEEVNEALRALVASRPDLARLVVIGRSGEGRPIEGVVLSDQPAEREDDEASLRVVGTHHGDEWSAMEVTLALAEELVARYGGDPAVTTLLDNNEVWIVPVLNPDGVHYFTRRNANDVDINRNYGYQWQSGSWSGSAPFSEAETAANRAWALTRAFHTSLSTHSGATNLGWVWNYTYDLTPDEDWLRQAATFYLDSCTEAGFYITNGAAWYPTNGDSNDWSYGRRGGQDYTLELTGTKAPPEDEIPDYVARHMPALLALLTAPGTSCLRGRVTGPGGEPVEARITVVEAPWPAWSDPDTGVFHRPLPAGEWTVDVQAPGYEALSLEVTVPDQGDDLGRRWVDVALQAQATRPPVLAEGLELDASDTGTFCLAGAALRQILVDGGSFRLERSGLVLPVDATPASTEDGCNALTVDPDEAPDGEATGEWTLVLTDAGADEVIWPLSVLIADDPSLPGAAQLSGSGPYTLSLPDAPAGAQVRLRGPDGVRRLASESVVTDGVSVTIAPSGWPAGAYSLRVLAAGRWSYAADLLELDEAGTLVLGSTGDDDDDDDDTGGDDDDNDTGDDDDIDAGDDDTGLTGRSDCSCSSSSAGASSLALILPLVLRRRRR